MSQQCYNCMIMKAIVGRTEGERDKQIKREGMAGRKGKIRTKCN